MGIADSLHEEFSQFGEVEEIGASYDGKNNRDLFLVKIKRKKKPRTSDFATLGILNAIHTKYLSHYKFVDSIVMDEERIDIILYV